MTLSAECQKEHPAYEYFTAAIFRGHSLSWNISRKIRNVKKKQKL